MRMELSPGSPDALILERMVAKDEIPNQKLDCGNWATCNPEKTCLTGSNQFAKLLAVMATGLVCTNVAGCGLVERFAPNPSSNADLLSLLESEDAIVKSGSEESQSQQAEEESLKKINPQNAALMDARIASAIQCIEGQHRSGSMVQAADPTNYDRRVSIDESGQSVISRPLFIIFHETVSSEEETLNYFRTPHLNDADQASYHVLIAEDGRRIRIVNDDQRAFGAGQSAFGDFTVQLKPGSAGSLNNVALHIGLVSPSDGRGDTESHSGYTLAQYESLAGETLAWQVKYGIPRRLVTTHKAIDRSGTRKDPRSFDWDKYDRVLRSFAQQCGAMAYTQ